jgi:pimeloyl-ACP methyl ester carboxylesterase
MRETAINLGDLSLPILEAGEPCRRSILFLHGWPQRRHALASLMSTLADEVHGIAVDLPGAEP